MMNNHTPDKFSFIIPTKNRKELLQRALNSINKIDSDCIEVIVVVDDLSSSVEKHIDIELFNRFFYSCGKGKIFSTGGGSGGARARNLGLLNCTGFYVCFLDDDDYVLPNRIDSIKNLLSKYEDFNFPDVILAPVLINEKNNGGLRLSVKTPKTFDFYSNLSKFSQYQIGGVTVKKDVALETMFDESLKKFQDTQFVIDATFNRKVLLISEPIAVYDLNRDIKGVFDNHSADGIRRDLISFFYLFNKLNSENKFCWYAKKKWALRCFLVSWRANSLYHIILSLRNLLL